MTTTRRARFDGKVLITEEPVDLPVGEVLNFKVTVLDDLPATGNTPVHLAVRQSPIRASVPMTHMLAA